MKPKFNFYYFIKKIHLFASLAILALLIMYLTTSFMMIYHDYFKVTKKEDSVAVAVMSEQLSEANWPSFLDQHKIHGRLVNEYLDRKGNLIRRYEKVGHATEVIIFKENGSVQINRKEFNLAGKIIGLHRIRGYGGKIQYNIYAVLLDITGISLILFAITGVILWLKLLKHNKIAWMILILGFLYVSSIIGYLIFI